jgi:hypothetical protein
MFPLLLPESGNLHVQLNLSQPLEFYDIRVVCPELLVVYQLKLNHILQVGLLQFRIVKQQLGFESAE